MVLCVRGVGVIGRVVRSVGGVSLCVCREVVCRASGCGLCMENIYVFYGLDVVRLGPACVDWMGMDSMRAFDVMHSSTRADACGRRGIDDDGWERETKTR